MGLKHRWELDTSSTETERRLGTDRAGSLGRRKKQRTLSHSADSLVFFGEIGSRATR